MGQGVVYRLYENRNYVWDTGLLTWVPMTQPTGGGGGGGGAVTVADGADVTQGATADAAVQGDNPGTVSAKLRGLNKSIAAGLAVTGPLTDAQLRASAVPVSAASLPLPTNAATSTKQSDGTQKMQVVDGAGAVIGSTGNALDVNIKTPATLPVSAASLPLPTGAATEAGHLATIDSNIALIKAKTDNLDVALSTRTKPADAQHVIIDSSAALAVTGPLTDVQLRASAVAVHADLVAPTSATGTITVAGQLVPIATQNMGTVLLTFSAITGPPFGTIYFEGTNDSGVTWVPIYGKALAGSLSDGSMSTNFNPGDIAVGTSGGGVGTVYAIPCAGFQQVRLNALAFGGGTLGVTLTATPASNLHDNVVRLVPGGGTFDPVFVQIGNKNAGLSPWVTGDSEAATANKPALVVAISPNSPVSAAVTANVVDEGSPNYKSTSGQQALTQTKDGRLRVIVDASVIESLDALHAEVKELRNILEMAFT